MIDLSWCGSAPLPAWVAALNLVGVAVTKAGANPNARLTVIRTAGKELPKPPPRGPWLWLSTTPASAEHATRAVLAGALDVLSVEDPAFLTKLVARAVEAGASEPAVPECSGFVAHSEPGRR